jgi:hypothetical protein
MLSHLWREKPWDGRSPDSTVTKFVCFEKLGFNNRQAVHDAQILGIYRMAGRTGFVSWTACFDAYMYIRRTPRILFGVYFNWPALCLR